MVLGMLIFMRFSFDSTFVWTREVVIGAQVHHGYVYSFWQMVAGGHFVSRWPPQNGLVHERRQYLCLAEVIHVKINALLKCL